MSSLRQHRLLFVLIICKRWLGRLLFIDCRLFNHLRPPCGISNPTLVRNPFPDGDITGEPQKKAVPKEGNKQKLKVNLCRGQMNMAFLFAFKRVCVFANMPFREGQLLSVPGDFMQHGDMGCALLIFFQVHLIILLQITWHFKQAYMFPYAYMCKQRFREQKPQSRGSFCPLPSLKGMGMVREKHNSCLSAHQEIVKRQTAKEENSIWNLQNLPQHHWNTRLTLRWGIAGWGWLPATGSHSVIHTLSVVVNPQRCEREGYLLK